MKIELYPDDLNFNISNAHYLASLSDLVYQDLDKISEQLKDEYGLTAYASFDNEKTHTQAFVACNKNIIVLVFRGTTSWADWMTNFNIPMVSTTVGRVHSGFNTSLDSIWNDVYDAVVSRKEKNQTVWVTGHSLGGALATLATNRFTAENIQLISGLYTFGQPRVGDKRFTENFDRKMKKLTFRLVNDQDMITKVPLPGYYHIGNEYFIDRDGNISNINNYWKWFLSASKSVEIRSSDDAYKPGFCSSKVCP